jgi:hypothetical protein
MNGYITASSSSEGSGIGSGGDGFGNSTVLSLTIMNGNITASSSSWGAGIGAGRGGSRDKSFIGTLAITGGRITANGTLAGIGSGGEGGEVKLLKITGNAVLTCDANFTKFPVNASSIVLTTASLVFTTPRNRLFGVSPSSSGSLNLVIVYGNVTMQGSEPISKLNATFLQIGKVTAPLSNDWTVCTSGGNREACYATHSPVVRSLLVSIPSQGNYSSRMFSDALSGFLERDGSQSTFVVAGTRSFVASAHFVLVLATQAPTPTGTFTISLPSRLSSKKTFLIRFGCFIFSAYIYP